MRTRRLQVWVLLVVLLGIPACDRNIEPFVAGEEPRQPDLSRIFPEPEKAHAEQQRAEPREEASDPGSRIRGTVRLAPGLEVDASRGAVVFVMARPGGMPEAAPVAVARVADPQFPLDFEIGVADMMAPEEEFAGEFELMVRLDTDGNATTRLPGDLQGVSTEPVPAGSEGVVLVLDRRI